MMIIVKIVSQLIGDIDFVVFEMFVVFVLGLIFFVIMLGLNIVVFYVVCKYWEQYE